MKDKKKSERNKWSSGILSWLRMAVPEERGIWLICVGISLFFWILVKMSNTYTSSLPVDYRLTLPENKALARLPPANLSAEVRSTGWNLLREFLQQDSIWIAVNLQQSDNLTLDGSQLRSAVKAGLANRDLDVVDLNYNRLNFELEPLARRKVAVRVPTRLDFHAEYQLLGPIQVDPDSVWISGPVSQVPNIQMLETDSIALDNLQLDQVMSRKLESPLPTVQLETQEVQIKVQVEQFTEWEEFIPLQVLQDSPDSLNLFPKKVHLSCTVGLSRYDQLSADDFTVQIDLRKIPISADRNTLPIEVSRKPDYVRYVTISPKAAEFFVIKEREGEK